MGKKAEVGTPKYLANKMKSKGLQKLRWYCQMCQKQCRDENGFKCHTMSESHQRQLLLFAEKPNQFLGEFSHEFEGGFINLLKRPLWHEATKVDDTEKGWYIAWIDRDPDTIARQEAMAKKDKMVKDDEEKLLDFISKQVERAKNEESSSEPQFSELQRESEDEVLQLDLKLLKKVEEPKVLPSTNIFKKPSTEKLSIKKDNHMKRKHSALDEIKEEIEAKKKRVEEQKLKARIKSDAFDKKYWLKEGIVYGAVVSLINGNSKIKLDQEHLETVVPSPGRKVIVLNGFYRGETGTLKSIIVEEFAAKIELKDSTIAKIPYEHFNRVHTPCRAVQSLPLLWPTKPRAWFRRIEAQFQLYQVQEEWEKYHHLLYAIDDKVMDPYDDESEDALSTTPNSDLKAKVLDEHKIATQDKIERLFQLIEAPHIHWIDEIVSLARDYLSNVPRCPRGL
ncbi:KIN [Lepeophtheirus salmonis]|uniref:KIN n=1 Tax=Lepeophtheirus salmonis TaxID=72036 RepID=A0A7R8D124_LEPSM|nr:KIN [Lepeophtheirus salmonis]CAF2989210.1 KIN [Lepeophtheirus salmonis]